MFSPFSNLCIDERLVLYKGSLLFKQYIPSKRFGIKLFILFDVETKFILDFIVYAGAGTDILENIDLEVPGSIVCTLLEPYLNKGHNIWVDNWYSSPVLFDLLHQHKTNSCGTVRKNRKGLSSLNNN